MQWVKEHKQRSPMIKTQQPPINMKTTMHCHYKLRSPPSHCSPSVPSTPPQTLTEVLVLEQATAEAVLVSPFASGELLLAARTPDWGRAVLAADLIADRRSSPRWTPNSAAPSIHAGSVCAHFWSDLLVGSVLANWFAWHSGAVSIRRLMETVDPGWQLAPGRQPALRVSRGCCR